VQNSTGVDFTVRKKVYANITGTYVDHVPLNDSNTVFAKEYYLLGGRIGYKINTGGSAILEVYAGVDNALNKKYSLGNDLNAFGGRFFNAAAPRNYFVGVRFNFARFRA
jgi:iron complex outermembrane receptor protein